MIPETLHDNPLAMAFNDLAANAKFALAELTIEVEPVNIVKALGLAKNELKFERLSTVTGVDRYPAEPVSAQRPPSGPCRAAAHRTL